MNLIRLTGLDLINLKSAKKLKTGLLSSLQESAGSDDLSALVNYAEDAGQNWTDDDRKSLIKSFENYLENAFSDELANCSSESELSELSGQIDRIGEFCDIDVSDFQEKIDEQLADLQRPDEDDFERPSAGQQTKSEMSSGHQEEAEVVRLFDGLIS